MKSITDFDSFLALDIRIGTVLNVEELQNARKPAYVLQIDFGEEIGVLKSSAQVRDLYTAAELRGKQIVAVVNFPEKQIAQIKSQCLVLGVQTDEGVVLLQTERKVDNGSVIS